MIDQEVLLLKRETLKVNHIVFLLLGEIGHLNDFTPHKGHLIGFQMCQIMRITVTVVSHNTEGIIGIVKIHIIPINQE